jgi:AcrR family transcriptional regulator
MAAWPPGAPARSVPIARGQQAGAAGSTTATGGSPYVALALTTAAFLPHINEWVVHLFVRVRPPHRLRDLIQSATRVFLARGYRQTQIADVARAMGVAPGTIYLYAESKEALFDLVVRASVTLELLDRPSAPAWKTPASGETLRFIKTVLRRGARFPALEKALRGRSTASERELEQIVRELFHKTSRHWVGLKLLERCALDWPELAAVWFGGHRRRLLSQLTRYLGRRMAAGRLRPAPDPAVAARLILELVGVFAMHCKADSLAEPVPESVAEEVVVDAVVHAYSRRRR